MLLHDYIVQGTHSELTNNLLHFRGRSSITLQEKIRTNLSEILFVWLNGYPNKHPVAER